MKFASLSVFILSTIGFAADDPVAALDKSFVRAYEKSDLATVKKYLDADFTWIDTDGVLYFKDDALALGLNPLVPPPRTSKSSSISMAGDLDPGKSGQQVRRAFLGATSCGLEAATQYRDCRPGRLRKPRRPSIMCQPTYNGKAYWASRIFAPNKDGLWMMMESYHTTIQASGVMNEVQGK